VSGMLGGVLIAAGERARGLDLLFSTAGGPELRLGPGVWRIVFLETATRAWLAVRRRGEAAQAAGLAEQSAAALGLKSASAIALRARAAVLFAEGNSPKAAEAALVSAATAEEINCPIEAARACMLAGRALVASGNRASGVSEYERAASAFARCGADRYRQQAEHALRRLGRRFQGTPVDGRREGEAIASLTRREIEIAQLVSERKSNREIAGELFLSEKTVEAHLRNIFGKLGISSRSSISRLLDSNPNPG
jgi:DNA-binding CsgD family transcriptional regulator